MMQTVLMLRRKMAGIEAEHKEPLGPVPQCLSSVQLQSKASVLHSTYSTVVRQRLPTASVWSGEVGMAWCESCMDGT